MSQSDERPRVAVPLDGEWSFLLDPESDGAQRGLHEPNRTWPSDAKTVSVPHVWQEEKAYRDYVGTAWYRTTVEYDGHGERVFLQFGAVDYEVKVYVNGEQVGTNRGGYLPFEVEITNTVSLGENVVAIEVTDPADLREIPHGKQGKPWYTRVSGIWQSVSLESRSRTFVSDVKATPNLDEDAVSLEIAVDAVADDVSAAVTIRKDEEDVATAMCAIENGSGECTTSIDNPAYWTPDRPHLYDVVVELQVNGDVVDTYEDYFGMRSVSVDSERLYLNGDPFYIRGALDQAYYPDTLYRPFAADLFEYEIRKAKELGFNMLRKHIKPAHPDFIETADRLGILVWEEPANPDVYTARSKEEVRDQLRGMIERDYNSPSVVVWSLYNEEWGIGLDQEDYSNHEGRLWNDEDKQGYLTELFYATKDLDPTRLICDNSGWAHVATDLNDYHEYFVNPDRAGAWADKLDELVANPGDNYAVENTPASDAPVLISEFGTWGFPDLPKLRDHYGGDPTWFSHDFLDDPLKRPEGVDERYEATNLPEVFDGYAELAEVWQERESRSLKGVIEEMRTHEGIAGYVVTEFSDIEWEFNGILDYLRNPKSFTDDFATINSEVLIAIDPERHVVAPGEEIVVDAHVVNDTVDSMTGELRWNGVGVAGSRSVSIGGFDTTTFEGVLTVSPSPDIATGPQKIKITLKTDDRIVSSTESVVIVGSECVDRTVYATGSLAATLDGNGITVTDDLSNADIAIVIDLDEEVSAFVERGNPAVVVPGTDGRMVPNDHFEYRNLPAGESWNLVASLLYQDSDLVADLCPGARVGWAFEDLFPHDLAVDLDAERDEVHVGSIEGWIANWGSPLLVRDYGNGRLCSCTFRVTETYGEHPTATTLVDRFLRTL